MKTWFVCFYIRETGPYPGFIPRRFMMVDSLAVHEGYHRRGVGRALMQAVEEKAGELGIHDIRLHVWEANQEAQRFYEALGYQTLSRTLIKLIDPRDSNRSARCKHTSAD